MPLKRIICPHCEKSVEVSMTSVTRSRDCPNCGNTILLQFTTQEKRQRRKALLMPAEDTGREGAASGPQEVMPMPIQGDLRERMMADPEVRQRVRVVKISVLLIVVLTVVVVLGSMFHWWSGISDSVSQALKQYQASRITADDDTRVETRASAKDPKIQFPKSNDSKTVPPEDQAKQDEAAIMKVVTSFLKAPNVDERIKLVLNRVTAEPRMREYYKHHGDGPYPYESMENLGPESGMKDTFAFSVLQKNGERRKLMVRKSQAKGYLVDWPSFVIYSDTEWSEFVNTRPQKPTLFRITARSAEVYRNDFIDPGKLVCLQLNNPLDPQDAPLYGYAERSSSLGHTLEFVMRQAAGAAIPLTVKISFPVSGGGTDQVIINDFVEEGWMTRTW